MNPSLSSLEAFIGEWDCKETYHAGGWTPSEITSVSASDSIRLGAGGNCIVADYQSDSAIGHYAAHSVIVWDERHRLLRLIFVDSFGNFQEQNGEVSGNQAIFSNPDQLNGAAGVLRRTYTWSKGKQHLVVDFVAEGGKLTPLVTIDKTRIE